MVHKRNLKPHKKASPKTASENDLRDVVAKILKSNKDEKEKKPKKQRWRDRDDKVKLQEVEDEDFYTVFVGNVSKDSTKKDVKRLFKRCGEIKSIRLRGLISEKPNLHKRLALATNRLSKASKSVIYYIQFASDVALKRALKFNGHLLDGRHIRVDHECNEKKWSKRKMDRTVFVGNVPYDADEEELHDLFEKKYAQAVEGVRIIRDPISGIGKGFAYLTFKTSSGPDLAILDKNLKLKGRKLRISTLTENMHKQNNLPKKIMRKPKGKDTRALLKYSFW